MLKHSLLRGKYTLTSWFFWFFSFHIKTFINMFWTVCTDLKSRILFKKWKNFNFKNSSLRFDFCVKSTCVVVYVLMKWDNGLWMIDRAWIIEPLVQRSLLWLNKQTNLAPHRELAGQTNYLSVNVIFANLSASYRACESWFHILSLLQTCRRGKSRERQSSTCFLHIFSGNFNVKFDKCINYSQQFSLRKLRIYF